MEFGSLASLLRGCNNRVLTLEKLTRAGFDKLVRDEAVAIHVPKFYSSAMCKRIADWVLNQPAWSLAAETKGSDLVYKDLGVYHVGSPFSVTYGKHLNSQEMRSYFQENQKFQADLVTACIAIEDPIFKLRKSLCDMDMMRRTGEQQQGLCDLATFVGKPMHAGIARIITPSAVKSDQEPRVDSLPSSYPLHSQFSASIYLRMPSSGGGVELWDGTQVSQVEFEALDSPRCQRSELGKSEVIAPVDGGLVIFNSRRPHAVRRFGNGTQISMSCFIGYNPSSPLVLWS